MTEFISCGFRSWCSTSNSCQLFVVKGEGVWTCRPCGQDLHYLSKMLDSHYRILFIEAFQRNIFKMLKHRIKLPFDYLIQYILSNISNIYNSLRVAVCSILKRLKLILSQYVCSLCVAHHILELDNISL